MARATTAMCHIFTFPVVQTNAAADLDGTEALLGVCNLCNGLVALSPQCVAFLARDRQCFLGGRERTFSGGCTLSRTCRIEARPLNLCPVKRERERKATVTPLARFTRLPRER